MIKDILESTRSIEIIVKLQVNRNMNYIFVGCRCKDWYSVEKSFQILV